MNIEDLIKLSDVMAEHSLGPNGGEFVYCYFFQKLFSSSFFFFLFFLYYYYYYFINQDGQKDSEIPIRYTAITVYLCNVTQAKDYQFM